MKNKILTHALACLGNKSKKGIVRIARLLPNPLAQTVYFPASPPFNFIFLHLAASGTKRKHLQVIGEKFFAQLPLQRCS